MAKEALLQVMEREFFASEDPDHMACTHMASLVHARRLQAPTPIRWQPGQKLKILLITYSGAGNIGADIRVSEIVRQLRSLYGEDHLELSLLSPDRRADQELFPNVAVKTIDKYFPVFVAEQERAHDVVIACEGSMFKSTFSPTLTAMLSGGLGLAVAAGKPAIAYGAEAGKMQPYLADMVKDTTVGSLVMCRNDASRDLLQELGVACHSGTDPAWTFAASSRNRAEEILHEAGWNGNSRVLTLCPINPFWWPIRPDFKMAEELATTGAHKDIHLGSVFFHAHSPERVRKYTHYLHQIAEAANRFAAETNAFVVVAGMDRLDQRACRELRAQLDCPSAGLVSGEVGHRDMVAVLRRSDWLVSSRFHALVTAMPAGTASLGISMDERIGNLLGQRGSSRVLKTDDEMLGPKLLDRLRALDGERDLIAKESAEIVASGVLCMAVMGRQLAAEFQRLIPAFPAPDLPETGAYLPPLPSEISALVNKAQAVL
ncbi:polysaccharide pyruvyl transferase family protein [Rhodospirillum sp. A1_3_36]|uniref:polysaccharide pyruvyl transferase family protein n=1 Tax=Rhodospirillum sp. A1_3_36 TaxID=3391666 RepID=UPI0039A5998B